jgi:hypothetical protein
MGVPTLKEQMLKAYLNSMAGYCLLAKNILQQRMEDMLHDEDGIWEAADDALNEEEEGEDKMVDAMMDRLVSAMDMLCCGRVQSRWWS